jgi:dCMP deaminase
MELEKAKKYYQLAKYQAALFSKDPSKKVAAILIAPDTHQILSTGYNGICRKLKETEDRWTRPKKLEYVVHAEQNAVCNAARSGIKIENSICVVTMFPCVDCCKALIQSGIDTIVCEKPDLNHERWGESFKISLELLDEANIDIMYV